MPSDDTEKIYGRVGVMLEAHLTKFTKTELIAALLDVCAAVYYNETEGWTGDNECGSDEISKVLDGLAQLEVHGVVEPNEEGA